MRTCRKCGEAFELTPDKAGHIDDCLNCVQDPQRLAKINREVGLPGYEQVGLRIDSGPFIDPTPRRKRKSE